MRILLAGATGVIGRQTVPILTGAGHQVTGLARTPTRLPDTEVVAADALDPAAVADAVRSAAPDVIVHMWRRYPPVRPCAASVNWIRHAPRPPSTSPADQGGRIRRGGPFGLLSPCACRSRSVASGSSARSGCGGRLGGLGGLVELLDAGGQLEVTVGQPTLVVAGQGQGDRVPADVDVGVVAGRLGR
jgi:hypothetical protein